VKFSCDRCGKKYATADNPAPGRVYKLKCKACGHLIVVKASAGGAAEPHHEPSAVPPPLPPPEIPLEIGEPEPAAPPPWPNEPRARSFDATTHVSMPAAVAEDPTPQPGDGGYVDLFSDSGSSSGSDASPGDDPFFAAARASLPETYGAGTSSPPDPFAPLREVTPHETVSPEPPPMPKVPVIPKPAQQKSIVPMALMGGGVALLVAILAFVMLGRDAPPSRASEPARAASPAQPQPPPVEPSLPVVQPEPEPPPVQAQPTPPTLAEDAAQAKKAADDERSAREEKRRREREEAADRAAQARAERAERDRVARETKARAAADAKERAAAAAKERARDAAEAKERAREAAEAKARAVAEAKERAREAAEAKARAAAEAKERAREAAEAKARAAAEAKERAQAAREAAAREERVAAANEAEEAGSLTQAQIEGVLRASKPSFDTCMRAAANGDVKLDGRRIMLRLNIQPTGAVTYPTIDDVTVNGAELGACLKGAARGMLFPKFSGDTLHVEVPLALAGR
jgi:TolA protein